MKKRKIRKRKIRKRKKIEKKVFFKELYHRLQVFIFCLVISAASAGFGWWLYEGTSKGDFKCSISFIPCGIIGLFLMGFGGIMLLGAFSCLFYSEN